MTPEAIRQLLETLREMDFTGAEKLAETIMKDAREPLWALGRALQWPGNPDRNKAARLLELLAELSILPWLTAARRLEGELRVQALSEACRMYEELHQQVSKALRTMLKSQTPVPPPDAPGAVEVRIPITREGDEAYLLLRRLDKPDEAEGDERRNRLRFARMSEEDRNASLRHYLESGKFQ